MKDSRWLGLAVILTITAVLAFNQLPAPWNAVLAVLSMVLGCVALVQEVRRGRR